MERRKNEKRARGSRPRNRYSVGARLSEYLFLRLLRAYADGQAISALSPHIRVSPKTIRKLFADFRDALPAIACALPAAFGLAGLLLMVGGVLTGQAQRFLQGLKASRLYRAYKRRHAPRIAAEAEPGLLFDLAVRLLCAFEDRGKSPDLLERILECLPRARSIKAVVDMVPGARLHRYPELRFYEDFRRYLLKHPINAAES